MRTNCVVIKRSSAAQHNNDRLCIELENQGKNVNFTAAADAFLVVVICRRWSNAYNIEFEMRQLLDKTAERCNKELECQWCEMCALRDASASSCVHLINDAFCFHSIVYMPSIRILYIRHSWAVLCAAQNARNHCASLNANWIKIASIKLMNEDKNAPPPRTHIHMIRAKTKKQTEK